MTEDELVTSLDRALRKDRPRLERYDRYYEGEQPLRYMAPALQAELGDRITQLVINWPRLGADAYENRLDVEGFRYARDASADEALWDMWQANNLVAGSQQAHLETLILGRSYVIVGAADAEGDPPVMTAESPLQVIHRTDPKTHRVASALKRWAGDDGEPRAMLYLPDSRVEFVRDRRVWREVDRDDHELGVVQVIPLLNRGRLLRQGGVSEFHDVVPIADAANKMATDMMVSGEFHAMPRRWVFGMTEADFEDEQGNALSTWSMIAGRLWASERSPSDVAVGQFPESDLAVFHSTLRVLSQVAAQVLALPPHYMSFATDNPASADAIRSSESQLVKRSERKQTALSDSWEAVIRLGLRVMTGQGDPAARSLETLWRDPSTPTVAQKADATVKLVQAGVVPVEQAREDLGYTSEQRRRMADMDEQQARRTLAGLDLGGVAVGVKPEADPQAA